MAVSNADVIEKYMKDGEKSCVEVLIETCKARQIPPASERTYKRICQATTDTFK